MPNRIRRLFYRPTDDEKIAASQERLKDAGRRVQGDIRKLNRDLEASQYLAQAALKRGDEAGFKNVVKGLTAKQHTKSRYEAQNVQLDRAGQKLVTARNVLALTNAQRDINSALSGALGAMTVSGNAKVFEDGQRLAEITDDVLEQLQEQTETEQAQLSDIQKAEEAKIYETLMEKFRQNADEMPQGVRPLGETPVTEEPVFSAPEV